jgi:molybdopterin-guanine dinucleotide biosynthesis protein
MLVLGVGGCCSGVGKTTAVCRLLETLTGWGALKVSPTHRDPRRPESASFVTHALEGDFRIDTDPGATRSDTGRFHAAGAARVAWLRSLPEHLGPGLDAALAGFSGLPGVIVEGNAPARERPPDALVLVARPGQGEIKASARELISRADWIVLNGDGSEEEIERALGRRPSFVIDATRRREPGTRAFVEAIRAWARR